MDETAVPDPATHLGPEVPECGIARFLMLHSETKSNPDLW